jgi:hypothetical protein
MSLLGHHLQTRTRTRHQIQTQIQVQTPAQAAVDQDPEVAVEAAEIAKGKVLEKKVAHNQCPQKHDRLVLILIHLREDVMIRGAGAGQSVLNLDLVRLEPRHGRSKGNVL